MMQQRRRATQAIRGHSLHVTREFLWFLWYRRNWWLMPIVLVLLLLALLAVLTGSGLSPFMYPL
jgi:hypothetical protein